MCVATKCVGTMLFGTFYARTMLVGTFNARTMLVGTFYARTMLVGTFYARTMLVETIYVRFMCGGTMFALPPCVLYSGTICVGTWDHVASMTADADYHSTYRRKRGWDKL
jgi:hypothetical protein